MSLFVPECLLKTARMRGRDGARWLESLPDRVAEIERGWSLVIGQILESETSWMALVRIPDGSEAVLKINLPDRESRFEAAALRAFEGRAAVRLLRASDDGHILLLERCVPGTNLWSLDEARGDAVAAEILRRLWREPPRWAPFERLSAIALEWCESLPRGAPGAGYDAALIARAVELARELTATPSSSVLLHGDFHPGNVLAAAREPWLAIDPKPLVGDPAYDLAQWLGNRCEGAKRAHDPVGAIRSQIDQLADLLELDPSRVAGWAFVKSLGWDWGVETAGVLLRLVSGGDASV